MNGFCHRSGIALPGQFRRAAGIFGDSAGDVEENDQSVGVKLHPSTFLTSVDTQGMVKRGDDYYSLDWDKSVRRISVDLQAAFGSVHVRWAP